MSGSMKKLERLVSEKDPQIWLVSYSLTVDNSGDCFLSKSKRKKARSRKSKDSPSGGYVCTVVLQTSPAHLMTLLRAFPPLKKD